MENLDYAIGVLKDELKMINEVCNDALYIHRKRIYEPKIDSLKAAIEILEQHKDQNK